MAGQFGMWTPGSLHPMERETINRVQDIFGVNVGASIGYQRDASLEDLAEREAQPLPEEMDFD